MICLRDTWSSGLVQERVFGSDPSQALVVDRNLLPLGIAMADLCRMFNFVGLPRCLYQNAKYDVKRSSPAQTSEAGLTLRPTPTSEVLRDTGMSIVLR